MTTRWNSEVVGKLKDGARKTLLELGIEEEDIVEFEVTAFTYIFCSHVYSPSGISKQPQ